jgi:hypothetical protein
LVLAWPQISLRLRGEPASYAVVTLAFTALIVAVVATWRTRGADGGRPASFNPLFAIAAIAAVSMIAVALSRWVRLLAWQPYHADMLIVLREATRRFLSGHDPYTTYHAYDAPWQMAMPYGPALWAPYLVPQLLRLDFRVVTIVGELFVPAWCGVAAVVEGTRGRSLAAASWLGLLAALLVAFDMLGFTLIGHTPAYWPLFPLLAILVARSASNDRDSAAQPRWPSSRGLVAAACVVGLLVLARTTMVAIVPVFLMAVWHRDRNAFAAVAIALAVTIAIGLAPFVLWDPRAIWDSMVASYPRVMKDAVWPELARPGLTTVGITEWLLERHREWLITPVQLVVMTIGYAAAWFAFGRSAEAFALHPTLSSRSATALAERTGPLPWMALALLAFSMTTLFPVHYLYYDVLLMLASAAIADTLRAARVRPLLIPSLASVAILAAVVLAAVRLVASPYPRIAVGAGSADWPLRAGFSVVEHAGDQDFTWIVGNEARVILPRSSAAAADIVITGESPFDRGDPPQRMSAILNGTLLTDRSVPVGMQDIRIPAGRSAWWVGFNELRLVFASTVVPHDVGQGNDTRPLALSVHDIRVEKPRK